MCRQRLHRQRASWCRQLHAGRLDRQRGQKYIQPAPCQPRIHHTAPLRHQLHQRRQNATTQHRADNQHAAAAPQIIVQQQQRGHSQHRRRQQGLGELGQRGIAASAVRGHGLQRQQLVLRHTPAGKQRRHHAHGAHRLGVTQHVIRTVLGRHVELTGLHQWPERPPLVAPGQHHLHDGRHQRQRTQHRRQDEHQHQKHSCRRHFGQCGNSGAWQKLAQRAQVEQRLC